MYACTLMYVYICPFVWLSVKNAHCVHAQVCAQVQACVHTHLHSCH
jgi:hypothetical protein